MHWLAHLFGLDNLSGPFYGFWSGVAGDVQTFTLPVALYVLLRRVNCHHRGCWRIGRHHYRNGTYIYCRVHHPEVE